MMMMQRCAIPGVATRSKKQKVADVAVSVMKLEKLKKQTKKAKKRKREADEDVKEAKKKAEMANKKAKQAVKEFKKAVEKKKPYSHHGFMKKRNRNETTKIQYCDEKQVGDVYQRTMKNKKKVIRITCVQPMPGKIPKPRWQLKNGRPFRSKFAPSDSIKYVKQ